MTTTSTRGLDEMFMALVYADADLVDVEFDAIISASWPDETPGQLVPDEDCYPAHWSQLGCAPNIGEPCHRDRRVRRTHGLRLGRSPPAGHHGHHVG